MSSYLKRNNIFFILYTLLSIVVYFLFSGLFLMYSRITEAAELGDRTQADQIVVAVILFLLGITLFMVGLVILSRYLTFRITRQIREDVMRKIFRLKTNVFLEKENAFYSSLLLNDVELLETNYFAPLYDFISFTMQAAVMLGVVFFIGWQYALLIALLSVPMILQPFLLKKRLGAIGMKVSEAFRSYTDLVGSFVEMFELIKFNQAESGFAERFQEETERLEAVKRKERMIRAVNAGLILLFLFLMKVGIQLYNTGLAVNLILDIATLPFLFALANAIANSLTNMQSCAAMMSSTKKIRIKLDEFFREEEEMESGKTLNFQDRICIQNLKFSFGDRILFDSYNEIFEKGKKYALIGESGCGKTTLLKLLLRNYDVPQGQIFIDSKDIREYRKDSLYDAFAYVSQDVHIIEGTIRDNITVYNAAYTQKQIGRAVNDAGLKQMLVERENGLDSRVEEGGKNLSGGELQRIALARAILSNRDIILIDEGFAALDNAMLEQLEDIILSLDKTVICVMHRFSRMLDRYDKVIELGRGGVNEN